MQKIAIIGASYLQMPLVLKSRLLGLQTHCFAWEKGAVCRPFVDYFYPVSTLDKEQILNICRDIKIDAILSIASDVAVPTVNFVASHLGLIGNNITDSEAFINKFWMRNKFKLHDVSSPQFLKINKDCPFDYNVDLIYPLIVKPVDRSGSRGVQKVTSPETLMDAIVRARNESFIDECIVEEFISGREVSVESISWQGIHYILAITDKVTTNEPYFVEIEHHQPSNLPFEIQKIIKSETVKALNALNFKYGASHSEFIITDNHSVFAIEVGARMGGDFIGSDLVDLSTGYDFLKGTINVSLGNFDEPVFTENKCSGVCFLSAETKHVLPAIENWKQYSEIIAAEITDNELHKLQCSADRSGFFIYQSENRFKINK